MDIEFLATYGDQQEKVSLTQPLGGGGGGWQIMIGKRYNGQIVNTTQGLRAYVNSPAISGDDAWILIDMIKTLMAESK